MLASSPPFVLLRTCHFKAFEKSGSLILESREKMIPRLQNGGVWGRWLLIKMSARGPPSQSFCSVFLLLLPDTYSGLISDQDPIQTNTQTTTQQRKLSQTQALGNTALALWRQDASISLLRSCRVPIAQETSRLHNFCHSPRQTHTWSIISQDLPRHPGRPFAGSRHRLPGGPLGKEGRIVAS